MEKNRNYFVAIALSVLILVAWQFLYVNPKLEKDRAALEAQQAAQTQQTTTTTAGGTSTKTCRYVLIMQLFYFKQMLF